MALGNPNKLKKISGKKSGEILADPQVLNSYSYVLNNPFKYTDASGNCVWDACITEGAYSAITVIGMVSTYVASQAIKEQINNHTSTPSYTAPKFKNTELKAPPAEPVITENVPDPIFSVEKTTIEPFVKDPNDSIMFEKAPEYDGGSLTESEFTNAAENYLGPGYKTFEKGRHVSEDGLRQVRYDNHETTNSDNHHAHFESYNTSYYEGGEVTENTTVDISDD